MVVIFLPTASLTEVWQDRTASPLTWTVQAPHRPAPQPNFVPVICNCSRMTHSSGVSLAASTDIFRPLMFKVGMFPPKGGSIFDLTVRLTGHVALSWCGCVYLDLLIWEFPARASVGEGVD